MNLSHVKYFVTACREGRITDAARCLYVTQQAVSAGIAALEHELGVRLLERTPTGVSPTLAGEELLPNMQALLDAETRLRARAATLAPGPGGTVSFAYASRSLRTNALHPNQDDLDAFSALTPNVSLRTFETASDACLALVAQGTADLALVAGKPDGPAFEGSFLCAPELVLCVAADHPFAARDGSLTYADLRGVAQLLPPDLNYSLRMAEEACRRCGFEPTYLETPYDLAEQMSFLTSGRAVAFAPEDFEGAVDNDAVRLVHMAPEEDSHIPLWLVWSSQRGLSPAAAAFAAYFEGLFA